MIRHDTLPILKYTCIIGEMSTAQGREGRIFSDRVCKQVVLLLTEQGTLERTIWRKTKCFKDHYRGRREEVLVILSVQVTLLWSLD